MRGKRRTKGEGWGAGDRQDMKQGRKEIKGEPKWGAGRGHLMVPNAFLTPGAFAENVKTSGTRVSFSGRTPLFQSGDTSSNLVTRTFG
jgi:hypothetical protein